MILYSYNYERTFNKIVVQPVEVVETQKMYKTKNGYCNLANYVSQVRKESLDTLIITSDMYMVSQVCDVNKFKYMIAEQLDKEHRDLLRRVSKVAKALEVLPECDVDYKDNVL